MVGRLNNSTGVLDALRYLQTSARDLSSAETRLSSGRKVNNARDNISSFHAAEIMRGQQSSLSAVTLSLGRAESISETAITAAEQISKLLIEMRSTAGAAMGEDLSPQQRQAYMTQFAEQKAALERFIHAASFDDANILNGSRPNGVTFIADSDASQTVTLAGRNFLPGNAVVTVGADHDLATSVNAGIAQEALAQSIANIGDQLNEMVAERKRIEAQKGFVTRLADALAAGVGRMVDTDLAVESALIQALQIKQELSAQSVVIVNNAPNTLLSLFRS
jgi:flagellin